MAFQTANVGDARTQNAHVIHTAVVIKAVVLNGQYRVFHDLWNLFDRGQIASFFAKLAHQLAIGGEHAQRQFGFVVGQVRDIGQVGVSRHHGHTHDHQQTKQASCQQNHRPDHQFDQPCPNAEGLALAERSVGRV